jgi:hypothetical protein
VPGVALPPGSSLPRINGGRPRTNEYLFDGISVLQPEPGQVAFFPLEVDSKRVAGGDMDSMARQRPESAHLDSDPIDARRKRRRGILAVVSRDDHA